MKFFKYLKLYDLVLIAVGFVLGGIMQHLSQDLSLTLFWLGFIIVAVFIVDVIIQGIKRRK